MDRPALIGQFTHNHRQLIDYIDLLPDGDFTVNKNDKWTPGQQLDHIVLCLQPLAQVLGAKAFIEQKFGTIKRPTWDFDTVLTNYNAALVNGGKAPTRFVPPAIELGSKGTLVDTANELVSTIAQQLDTYTEAELDTLVLPHPLLGSMTIREMFYLMTYHATHHQEQTERNLVRG
jgi:hypothetical protein